MKQFYKKLNLLVFLLLASTLSFAQTFVVNGIKYNVTSPTTVEVIKNTSNYKGVINIPSTVLTYTVTGIARVAFSYCSQVTEINIPNTVLKIGYQAFYGCIGITQITIPNSVINIDEGVFLNCTNLTTVIYSESINHIPNDAFQKCTSLKNFTIPNSIETIGSGAFHKCSTLTSISIPNFVSIINSSTFNECTSLTNVSLPNSLKAIDDAAFYNCKSLEKIIIPNSVTYLGDHIFYDCSKLQSVNIPIGITIIQEGTFAGTAIKTFTIPNTITELGNFVFSGCDSLKSVIIPNSITKIGRRLFNSCENLNSVILPNSLDSIGIEAFQYCTKIKNIHLPNSVKSIGSYAFENCWKLSNITIPNSVSNIEKNAFYMCNSLISIKLESSTPIIINSNVFKSYPTINQIYTTATLYVPFGSKTAYQNDTTWGKFTKIVEYKSVNNIQYNITSNTTVEIANNEEIITGNINIPSTIIIDNKTYTVTKISENAFLNCTGLTSITIPKTVTSIGNGAFKGCTSLTSITLEANSPITITSSVFERVANTNEIFEVSIYTTATLYVPTGSKTAYQNDVVWGKFTNIVEYTPTGTESLKSLEANINIFPNPASENVTISFNESISGIISIIDSKGNVVLTKAIAGNSSNISTTELASGVYVVKISSEKGVVVKQLVVR